MTGHESREPCREPHPPDFRCFDCATDEELADAIPPYPASGALIGIIPPAKPPKDTP